MPRPRLTLCRLMAWIAFAALNLSILGTAYRMGNSTLSSAVVIVAIILLVPIDFFLIFGYRQVRAIRAALADPTRRGLDAFLDPCAFLIFTALALVSLGAMLIGAMRSIATPQFW